MKPFFTHTTNSRRERLTFGFIMPLPGNDTRKRVVGVIAALALSTLLPSLASAQVESEDPIESLLIQQAAPPSQPVVVNGQVVQVPAEGGLGGYAGGHGFGGNATYNYDFFSAGDSGDEAEDIKKEIKEAEATLNTLHKKESDEKDDTKKKRLQAIIKSQELYITELKERQKAVEKYAYLNKKVDVTFKDATVQQAAEALAKASGVTIKVDESVPDSTRLTVTARKIRLVTVLENIGRQANLIIEPVDGGSGVELTVGSFLTVNGVTTEANRPFAAPWSDAWGKYPPGSRRRFSLYAPAIRLDSQRLNGNMQYEIHNALKGTTSESIKAYGDAFNAYELAAPHFQSNFQLTAPRIATARGVGTSAGTRNVTMKVTSEDGGTVVITESGTEKGEKGYFITVYKVDKESGKLNKVGTTFHKSLGDVEKTKPEVATPAAAASAPAATASPVPAAPAP